jgi:hypothetical protein
LCTPLPDWAISRILPSTTPPALDFKRFYMGEVMTTPLVFRLAPTPPAFACIPEEGWFSVLIEGGRFISIVLWEVMIM